MANAKMPRNAGNIKPSSSAPPDQSAPIPGADLDSKDGIQSKKGRATALTEEIHTKDESGRARKSK